MSNSRGNNPNLDYYELRRRHEEYKSRARAAGFEANNTARSEAPRKTEATSADAVNDEQPTFRRESQPAAEETRTATAKPVNDERVDTREAEPVDEDLYEDTDEAYEDDYAAEDDGARNPNPFDPFLHFLHGMREKLSAKRRSRSKGSDIDDYDGDDADYDDEAAYDDDEVASVDSTAADANSAPLSRAERRLRREAEAGQTQTTTVAEDIAEADAPQPAKRHILFNRHAAEDVDDIDDDAYEDDEDFDADSDELYADTDEKPAGDKSGLKKFINLFVTRVDEKTDDDEDGEDLYDDEGYADDEDNEDDDAAFRKPQVEDDKRVLASFRKSAVLKGGSHMSELNNNGTDIGDQSQAGQESAGMTRRQRRELAERRAAEEAARKAAEASALKQPAPTDMKPLTATADDSGVDMAAFGSAEKADVVETTAEDVHESTSDINKTFDTIETHGIADISDSSSVEEPTREFIPLTNRDTEKDPFHLNDAFDDEEDEEDDDEEEEEAPRRGLFARLRSRRQNKDDDDDEYADDDEDEEEDMDDEEDEEENDDRPTRRIGLFSRHKHADEDEEEDEDDDEDAASDDDEADEYDEDEFEDEFGDDDDDEYDSEDDEYDEYDEDDDEDEDLESHSIGHSIVGFFKVLLGIVIALIVLIIVLNFLYVGGNTGLLDKLHSRMGDSSAFGLLFPAYGTQTTVEQTVAPEVTEVPVEATPAVTAEATAQIPNLDDNNAAAQPVQPAATEAAA